MSLLSLEFSRLRALWDAGLIEDTVIVTRADEEIARRAPRDIPDWLMDLAMQGPGSYWGKGSSEPRAADLPFDVELAFRATAVEIGDDASALRFARWLSHACMGRSHTDPWVQLGYELDYLLDVDLQLGVAVELVREHLPQVLKAGRRTVEEWRPSKPGGEGNRRGEP